MCGVVIAVRRMSEGLKIGDHVPVPGPYYLDAHVHVYERYDAAAMLDRAAEAFAGYGSGTGVLGLTELDRYDMFRRWRDAGRLGRWTLRSGGEPAVLFGRRDDGRRLVVLAGRQIVTRRRLGVLALGVDRHFPDGEWIEASVEAARASGGATVVSYGVGKWWGRRGRVIDDLIERAEPGDMALGDIGARPRLGGAEPKQFRRARERGLTVLPGSDPLPLPLRGSQDVVGGCCAVVPGSFGEAGFGKSLVDAAARLGPDAAWVGGFRSIGRAVFDQAVLRFPRCDERRRPAPV